MSRKTYTICAKNDRECVMTISAAYCPSNASEKDCIVLDQETGSQLDCEDVILKSVACVSGLADRLKSRDHTYGCLFDELFD